MEFLEFLKILPKKLKEHKIDFSNNKADLFILKLFYKTLSSEEDNIQFNELKDIIGVMPIGHAIYTSIMSSELNKDVHLEEVLKTIENIADKMEENNISCYSYSYFIYSYLEYFKLIDVSENFSKIKFVPFKWVNPKYFDYSDLSKTFGEDISIGFGRKVTTLDDFIINGNVLKKYTGKSSYVIIPNTIEKIVDKAENLFFNFPSYFNKRSC